MPFPYCLTPQAPYVIIPRSANVRRRREGNKPVDELLKAKGITLTAEQLNTLQSVLHFRNLGVTPGNIIRSLPNAGKGALVGILFSMIDSITAPAVVADQPAKEGKAIKG